MDETVEVVREVLGKILSSKPVDDEVMYHDVVGDYPTRHVYGLKSLRRKKRRYADLGASTSQGDINTPKELLEGVQAIELVLLLLFSDLRHISDTRLSLIWALLLVPANPFHLKHRRSPPPHRRRRSATTTTTVAVVVHCHRRRRPRLAGSVVHRQPPSTSSSRTPQLDRGCWPALLQLRGILSRRRCRCSVFSSGAAVALFFKPPPLALLWIRRRWPSTWLRGPVIRPLRGPLCRQRWSPQRSSVASARTPLLHRPPPGRLRDPLPPLVGPDSAAAAAWPRLLRSRWSPSASP
ncbi:hypothetical protein Syun_029296 [Stephania yunnanensis]|uniref:Uncharacterized protein n=1 Tax=Stephania yunnanensis TaxID=152371 RepID=A0AAP0E8Q5_9MAGN